MKQIYQSLDSSKSLPHMASGRPHLTESWGSIFYFKTHTCLPFYSVRYIFICFTYINDMSKLITTKKLFFLFVELFWIFRYFFTHYVNARVEPSKSMAIGFPENFYSSFRWKSSIWTSFQPIRQSQNCFSYFNNLFYFMLIINLKKENLLQAICIWK